MASGKSPLSAAWFKRFTFEGECLLNEMERDPVLRKMPKQNAAQMIRIVTERTNDSMARAAKSEWLAEFDGLFCAQCKAAGINTGDWQQGMWVNAHMHHGQGLTPAQGVAKWMEHVLKIEGKTMKKKPRKQLKP